MGLKLAFRADPQRPALVLTQTPKISPKGQALDPSADMVLGPAWRSVITPASLVNTAGFWLNSGKLTYWWINRDVTPPNLANVCHPFLLRKASRA